MSNVPNADTATKELVSALGTEKVLTEDFILSSYARDATLFYYTHTRPACVVLPHSREDVKKIVHVANQYKVPVVPVGARAILMIERE